MVQKEHGGKGMRAGVANSALIEPEWEKFLKVKTSAQIYSSMKFGRFLHEITGARPLYMYAEEKGEIIATLPVMISRDGLIANSLPWYGSNPGVVVSNNGHKDLDSYLVRETMRELVRQGVKSWTFINAPGLSDPAIFREEIWVRGLARRVGMISVIPPHGSREDKAAGIMERVHGKTRNQIRKAIKSGVTVERVVDPTEDDLLCLYQTHRDNMEAVGAPFKSFQVFKQIAKTFDNKSEWDLFIAKKGEKRIAGLIVLYYASTAEYFIPAVDVEHRDLNPLNLLILEAMVEAASKGFILWNWGGTIPDTMPGVYHFKKRWGAIEFPYSYFCVSFDDAFWDRIEAMSSETIRIEYPFFYVRPFHSGAGDTMKI
jgi:hypothetical protein